MWTGISDAKGSTLTGCGVTAVQSLRVEARQNAANTTRTTKSGDSKMRVELPVSSVQRLQGRCSICDMCQWNASGNLFEAR